MNHALVTQVDAWIALDPDEHDRATLAGAARRERRGGARATLRRTAHLRHGRAARSRDGRAGGHEPRDGASRDPGRARVAERERASTCRAASSSVATRAAARSRSTTRSSRCCSAAACTVYEMPGPLPTPLVPYCVKALGAAAGIMITASHNPPAGQRLQALRARRRADHPARRRDRRALRRRGRRRRAGDRYARRTTHPSSPDDLLEAYRAHLLGRFGGAAAATSRSPTRRCTGSVACSMTTLFARRGLRQRERRRASSSRPTVRFPTLPFPNPEEPGALDLAIETATEVERRSHPRQRPRRRPAGRGGARWRSVASRCAATRSVGCSPPRCSRGSKRIDETVATTIVSSTLLAKMASAHGVPYATTLTGFKWIARAAGDGRRSASGTKRRSDSPSIPHVADKDGLSAALALAALADRARRQRVDRCSTARRDRDAVSACTRRASWRLRAEGPRGSPRSGRVVASLARDAAREPRRARGDRSRSTSRAAGEAFCRPRASCSRSANSGGSSCGPRAPRRR